MKNNFKELKLQTASPFFVLYENLVIEWSVELGLKIQQLDPFK